MSEQQTSPSILAQAQAMLKRAIEAGFKWPSTDKAADKVREELREVQDAIAEGNPEHIKEEVGDLMHAATAMAEYAGVDAENALATTNKKFAHRYAATERGLKAAGLTMHDAPFAEKIRHWNDAKGLEQS